MRYQFGVTDFAHQPALAHLSAAETRLSAVLARPRRIAIACVVALTALGWLALGLMAADSARVAGLGGALPAESVRRLGRAGAGGADVGGDDAGDDAADRRPDDPDLRRDRRHRGAQARARRLAAGADRRLCRGLARLCAGCGVAAVGAGARGAARRRQRSAGCSPARSFSAPGSISSPRSSRPA